MKDQENKEEEIEVTLEDLAASWHVKRSRGLTKEESEDLLQLIRKYPEIVSKLEVYDELKDAFKELDRSDLAEIEKSNSRNYVKPLIWISGIAAALTIAFSSLTLLAPRAEKLESGPIIIDSKGYPFTKALEDNSIIRINDGARLEVVYSEDRRIVHLLEGEAHFNVEKDKSRPFRVIVDGIKVEAVGTSFNVRRDENINIIVTEGVVRVLHAKPKASPNESSPEFPNEVDGNNFVSKGEVAQIQLPVENSNKYSIQVYQTDVEEVQEQLSWQESLLTLDGKTLNDIAYSFEQRTGFHMVIMDPNIKDLEIGGRFPSEDVYSFLRILEIGYGIPWREVEDRVIWVGKTDK